MDLRFFAKKHPSDDPIVKKKIYRTGLLSATELKNEKISRKINCYNNYLRVCSLMECIGIIIEWLQTSCDVGTTAEPFIFFSRFCNYHDTKFFLCSFWHLVGLLFYFSFFFFWETVLLPARKDQRGTSQNFSSRAS